jgi:hypothetical protein
MAGLGRVDTKGAKLTKDSALLFGVLGELGGCLNDARGVAARQFRLTRTLAVPA